MNMNDKETIDLLKLIFIDLTENGTEKTISIRVDLICIIKETSRGYTNIYVDMGMNDTEVFQVLENRQDIIEGMTNAYLQLKKNKDR